MNLLPWYPEIEQFALLFKMAKKTHKPLFCEGFSFYMQIYYCSTGYENINVINGQVMGSPLSKIEFINCKHMQYNDIFLDNNYGDFYTLIKTKNKIEWKPIANCGLHYKKNYQTNNDVGNLIKASARH